MYLTDLSNQINVGGSHFKTSFNIGLDLIHYTEGHMLDIYIFF